ncbi:DUF1800 domain-containing protein [Sulfurirhabdus autotrophica]|uniref:Uncharacterized protein (DUF1800 family) n=1 Tax=Sulfurirhabdus autotrophica TaxID=1706046 RepID=A0A4V2W1L9_9PROT|nr:DUF1800 domain-containing protein [Sulfurirhabdus autotrophica]TCV84739.1 uncharacterized protein (DUF1800 family) [Sulfurirhabdus autotrophica]
MEAIRNAIDNLKEKHIFKEKYESAKKEALEREMRRDHKRKSKHFHNVKSEKYCPRDPKLESGGTTGSTPPPTTNGAPGNNNTTPAQPGTGSTPANPTSPASEMDLALLAVTRLSYGPATGDLNNVTKMQFSTWLTQQLNPSQIDDSTLDQRLATIPALSQTNAQLRDSTTISAQKRSLSDELLSATLLRKVMSKRQLLEIMTEFWSDHFNVDINKEGVLPLKFADDKGIRTNALGRFRNLLGHSAHSPAMLYYLDNRVNRGKSPNENYAREVMELHTLGVKGGYTETDVKEVARCFTGWTVNQTTGEFMFDATIHDNGTKNVLGYAIPSNGQQEGEMVLDILANHPSTAQFIAKKLCQKLVSDNPSSSLIAEISAVFMANQGNIAQTIRAITMSADFGASQGKKLRRPFDYMAAALRVLGASLDTPTAIGKYLDRLDQFPFSWQPPTGYPDSAASWLNASGLLNRWNFAQALTKGITGISVNLSGLIDSTLTAEGITSQLEQRLLGKPLSSTSHNTIVTLLAGGQSTTQPIPAATLTRLLPATIGAMLSSPEFQVK